MNNKKYYWLKLKEDFFRNKKIKKLRTIAGGDTYTLIYLKMQLLSLRENGEIYFDGVEDTMIEEIALEIDESIDNVRVTLMYLIKNNMIEEVSGEILSLTEAKECIGKETASAERVRRHRDKKKMLQCNTFVTNGNTEIEIEKELEKREKREEPEKRGSEEEEEEKKINRGIDHLKKLFKRNLTEPELEIINEMTYTPTLILAIATACLYNAKTILYVETVYNDYIRKGIKKAEDIKNIKLENETEKETLIKIFEYDWLNDTEE